MKKFTFLLCLIAGLASCSEPEEKPAENGDGTPNVTYTQTEAEIITWKSGTSGSLEGFWLVLCSDASNVCRLTEETYAWFEMYSGNKLHFIGDYVDGNGVLHMTEESIQLFPGLPWGTGEESGFDYYQTLPVAAEEEGIYIFALKFYQPSTDSYYITPVYWMKLTCKGYIMFYDIRKLEQINAL